MLTARRPSARICTRAGSSREERMSAGSGPGSGVPSPKAAPGSTTGFVATRRKCTPRAAVPWAAVRTRRAALLLVLATALPRLVVVLEQRGAILSSFTDKGDDFARTFLASGTYGFIPGYPSADTQPLYGWFLIPLYWIFGRHWEVVGLAQIAVACGTTLVVWQIGRRWLSSAAGLVAGVLVALQPYLVWHDVHMNREILDQLIAASSVYLTLRAAERFDWKRAVPLGAMLGLGILGNVRLEALPLVLAAYLLVRSRK